MQNRIHAGGFKSRVPVKKPELSQYHKNGRIAFSHAHVGWNNPQWRRVMFSEESVVSEASGWQEMSLETMQRETCSSHSNPDSSLSDGGFMM